MKVLLIATSLFVSVTTFAKTAVLTTACKGEHTIESQTGIEHNGLAFSYQATMPLYFDQESGIWSSDQENSKNSKSMILKNKGTRSEKSIELGDRYTIKAYDFFMIDESLSNYTTYTGMILIDKKLETSIYLPFQDSTYKFFQFSYSSPEISHSVDLECETNEIKIDSEVIVSNR